MNKKSLVALALLLTVLLIGSSAALFEEQRIPNSKTFIFASIGQPEVSDPAWAYDTASAEMIFNVYETLVFFPYELIPTNPTAKYPDDPQGFVPMLATDWTISEDGKTYTFYIREGVKYHDPQYGTVKPVDVEYSIERALVFDHVEGPQWMYYFPLLNAMGSFDFTDMPALGAMIDDAVQVGNGTAVGTGYEGMPDYVENADRVIFNLYWSYSSFCQILSQAWGSIYPLQWGIDLYEAGRFVWPGWNYAGGVGDYDHWTDFNDNINTQAIAPFDNGGTVMMGSGPYKFYHWEAGSFYELHRFVDYWQGWPSPGGASYVDVYQLRLVESWTTRRSMFLSDLSDKQADVADVPTSYAGQVENEPGVIGVLKIPQLVMMAMNMNYNVSATSTIFTVKPKLGGVDKLNMFADKYMRQAWSHALDYEKFLIDAYLGDAFQPASFVIQGLPQYNATKPKYDYDLAKVTAALQQAWNTGAGTSAWDQGFYIPMCYNAGNEARRIACEMIEVAIESLGTKYQVEVFAIPWDSFMPAIREKGVTNFYVGWLWDYADAGNGISAYMHPSGTYPKRQTVNYGPLFGTESRGMITVEDFAPTSGRADVATRLYKDWSGKTWNLDNSLGLNNTYVASLIESADVEPDVAKRAAKYSELEDISYAAASSIPLAQNTGREYERNWVQGWCYNPVAEGALGYYAYHYWKGHDADISGDGKVDGADTTPFNDFYFEEFWDGTQWVSITGPSGYNRKADISSSFEVAGKPRTWELDGTALDWGHWGIIAGNLIPGIDGYVDIYDAALLSASMNDFVTGY